MATLTVHGGSDDLAELEGIRGADEFSVPSTDTWVGVIEAPDGETALIYVDYRKNGTWTVALGLFDEDYALPAWPVAITHNKAACSYSTYATIELPDGSTVREYSD